MKIASVVVPAMPLQLLVRAHPKWRSDPVVVVHEDRANAEVIFVNERARARGIVTGMRHGAAQALVPGLRSGVVAGLELGRAMNDLQTGLTSFTPRVEPSSPGIFFLDPSGLTSLYGDARTWANAVHRYLVGRGFEASVVVGFGRHRTLALARTRPADDPVFVVPDEAREIELVKRLSLETLGASPELRDAFARLAIRTIGDLLRLPPLELCARFGQEALTLHTMASENPARPFAPSFLVEPARVALEVDPPDADVERLLFVLKGGLDRLARELRARSEVLTALELTFSLDHAPARVESLTPAAPSLDVPLLVDLVRLRFNALALAAPVTAITLVAQSTRAHAQQLGMLDDKPRRDLDAAARAIARLRAAFGPESVVRAELRDAHLPEARFRWAPLGRVSLPQHVDPSAPPFARRFFSRPKPLLAGEELVLPRELGEVVHKTGPFRLSGGWWARTVTRDYYYIETTRGDLLWVYRDARREQWFLHGQVD